MIEKYFIVTSNSVELRINRVRINRSQPVQRSMYVRKYSITRMHSSRMCTARLVTYLGGSESGDLNLGGVCLRGVCLGVSALGCLSWCVFLGVSDKGRVCLRWVGRPPSPCGQNDWQTSVKTLPSRNFCGCNQHQACILETNYYFSFPKVS